MTAPRRGRPDNAPKLRAVGDAYKDGEFDGWETEGDDGYSPDKCYVSSRNSHDHSEQITLKLPPDLYAIAQRIAGDPRFPDYRTPHDLMRCALAHRLHYIATEWEPMAGVLEAVQMEMMQAESDAAIRQMERMRDAVQAAAERMDTAANFGDTAKLLEAVMFAKNLVSMVPRAYSEDLQRHIEGYESRLKKPN
jgi:hypothetical protein